MLQYLSRAGYSELSVDREKLCVREFHEMSLNGFSEDDNLNLNTIRLNEHI